MVKRVVEEQVGELNLDILERYRHALQDLHTDIHYILGLGLFGNRMDDSISWADLRRVCWQIGKPYPQKFVELAAKYGHETDAEGAKPTPDGGLKLKVTVEIADEQ